MLDLRYFSALLVCGLGFSLGSAFAGSTWIHVDLERQQAFLHKGGAIVMSTAISSGKRSRPTRAGEFWISQKIRNHYSYYGKFVSRKTGQVIADDINSKYNTWWPKGAYFKADAIPYFMRFNGPIGIHAGECPGYPASHGCIRMPDLQAAAFFSQSYHGTKVVVSGWADPDGRPVDSLRTMPGYRSQLVLAAPVVKAIQHIAWDYRGRVFVLEADSDGLARVTRHSDYDGDGVLDRHMIYARGLKDAKGIFPEGKGLYVLVGKTLKWFADGKVDGWVETEVMVADDLPGEASGLCRGPDLSVEVKGAERWYRHNAKSDRPEQVEVDLTKRLDPLLPEVTYRCDPDNGVVTRCGDGWEEVWAWSLDEHFAPTRHVVGPNGSHYVIDSSAQARIYRVWAE